MDMSFLNKIKSFVLYIIIGVLALLLFTNRCNRDIKGNANSTRIDTVVVWKTVEVPVTHVETDTIFFPTFLESKEITVVDSSLLRKYEDALDQIKRDSIFKAAISIREYQETFEDSLSKITVNSEVQGSLRKQSLNYTLKARRIDVPETTITKEKRQVFAMRLGASMYIPTTDLNTVEFGGNISMENSKGDIYEVGVTTNKTVLLGYKKTIFRIKR